MTVCLPQELARARRGVIAQAKQLLRPLMPYLPPLAPAPSWRRAFRVLRHYGFRPATVFDIGVAFGTHELYHAYPDAFYYLIDPAPESHFHMQRIAQRLHAKILNVALSDRDGDATFEIRSDIQSSTLFEECGPREFLRRETVPVRRFDTVIDAFERPALCKIDVQGAELLVLKGMADRIREIDVFVLEVSTLATLQDGPEAYDVIRFMKERGFVVFDIIGMKRRPVDDATAQLDMLFVAEQSFFRSDRRWARAKAQ